MRWLNRVQHRKCRSSGNTLLKHRMLWPVRRWVPTLLFVLVACGDGDDAVEPGTDGGVGAGDATGVDPSQDVDSTGDSKTRGDTRQAPPLATVVLEDTTVTGSVEEPTSHVIIKGTVTVVGLEGGGDDHGTAHTWEEFNYHGGHAIIDDTVEKRMTGTIPLPGAATLLNARLSAGGITGVWAEENTRNAIFDAMRRKETFGSSGVRIKPRFFASWPSCL